MHTDSKIVFDIIGFGVEHFRFGRPIGFLGDDLSEMIAQEGKAGRKVGEKLCAKMVPSPAASYGHGCVMRKRTANSRPRISPPVIFAVIEQTRTCGMLPCHSPCRTSAGGSSGWPRYRTDLLKQAQHVEVVPALLHSVTLKDEYL